MTTPYSYNQQMNIKYDHLELIDVPAIIAENKEKWFNQSLTTITGTSTIMMTSSFLCWKANYLWTWRIKPSS